MQSHQVISHTKFATARVISLLPQKFDTMKTHLGSSPSVGKHFPGPLVHLSSDATSGEKTKALYQQCTGTYYGDTSSLDDAFMHKRLTSSQGRVMVCCLFVVRLLTEPILTHCQLKSWALAYVTFKATYRHLSSQFAVENSFNKVLKAYSWHSKQFT